MDLNFDSLQLYLFSGHTTTQDGLIAIYDEAYRAWKKIWSQTFKELGSTTPLFSDSFTRQDKIAAIFHKNKCIALAGLRECDFSFRSSPDDSIFDSWSEVSFNQLIKDGPQVLICSNLAVHPDYRGIIAFEATLKDLIIFVSVKVLLDSNCDVMCGTTRNDRKVSNSAYSNGAIRLDTSIRHGVDVDLVAFYRQELKSGSLAPFQLLGEKLWAKRCDFTNSKQRKNIKIAS